MVGLCVQSERPKTEGASIIFVVDQGGFVKDTDHCFAGPVPIGLLALDKKASGAVGSGMLSVSCFAKRHQRPCGLDGL